MANYELSRQQGPGPSSAVDTAADGLRRYLLRVYNLMAAALVLTGVVAYVGAASGWYSRILGTPWYWVVLLSPLAVVMFLGFRIEKLSARFAQAMFWIYAALVGLSLSAIFMAYTGQSISRVFFVTSGTFAATAAYGYLTRRDLAGMGSFLMMGLIGLIIGGLVNLFLKSSALQLTLSAIGVIVFVGLTAYDMQRIKTLYSRTADGAAMERSAVIGALALYLDYLNLFLAMLQLFGNRRQ